MQESNPTGPLWYHFHQLDNARLSDRKCSRIHYAAASQINRAAITTQSWNSKKSQQVTIWPPTITGGRDAEPSSSACAQTQTIVLLCYIDQSNDDPVLLIPLTNNKASSKYCKVLCARSCDAVVNASNQWILRRTCRMRILVVSRFLASYTKHISALAILATLIAYLAALKDESEPSKGTTILLRGDIISFYHSIYLSPTVLMRNNYYSSFDISLL
jgi:hypothetical protein